MDTDKRFRGGGGLAHFLPFQKELARDGRTWSMVRLVREV